MTKKQLAELKQELKTLAARLKEQKPAFRKMQSAQSKSTEAKAPSENDVLLAMRSMWRNKYEYRHKHIVYCLARGRSRDEIEQPSESNMPDEMYIKNLLMQYALPIKQNGDFRKHIDWEKSDFVPKRARKLLAKEKLVV